jgi:hypothetical protein
MVWKRINDNQYPSQQIQGNQTTWIIWVGWKFSPKRSQLFCMHVWFSAAGVPTEWSRDCTDPSSVRPAVLPQANNCKSSHDIPHCEQPLPCSEKCLHHWKPFTLGPHQWLLANMLRWRRDSSQTLRHTGTDVFTANRQRRSQVAKDEAEPITAKARESRT